MVGSTPSWKRLFPSNYYETTRTSARSVFDLISTSKASFVQLRVNRMSYRSMASYSWEFPSASSGNIDMQRTVLFEIRNTSLIPLQFSDLVPT